MQPIFSMRPFPLRRQISAAIVAVLIASPAVAERSPLGQVPAITEGLIAVAIAYEIGKRCPDVNARMLRGISYLNALKAEARSLGYSDAEIDSFVDDRAEQDRLEGIARERLRVMGGLAGDAQSHCVVGRAEIASGSVIGQLLR